MKNFTKTKIVATLGPASAEEKTIKDLVREGVSVFRLNCSFLDESGLKEYIEKVRKATEETKRPIAVLQDLTGPRVRIEEFENQTVELKDGQSFTLTTGDTLGNEEKVSINYPKLPEEVKPGDSVYLDDANIKLKVTETGTEEVKTKVLKGGLLSSHKGINVPGTKLSLGGLTPEDKKMALAGAELGVDFLGLSYVKSKEDITSLREFIQKENLHVPGIISKIERKEALENIDSILDISDGIMIARGDLGLEVPIEKMARIQKDLIIKSLQKAIPVITATHLLKSMTELAVPTRAEATDAANAVLDGSDAVMLSEETAVGRHPVEVVRTLRKIIQENEKYVPTTLGRREQKKDGMSINHSISVAAVQLSQNMNAKAIVAYTMFGSTPRRISRERPQQTILGTTPNERTLRRLTLSWGVRPVLIKEFEKLESMRKRTRKVTLETKTVQEGDKVVVTAGIPFSERGNTNMVMVEEI